MTHVHGPSCNHEQAISTQLKEIMLDCLYTPEELGGKDVAPEGAVLSRGVAQSFAFHPERLMNNSEKLRTILREVIQDAFLGEEGGMSFLMLVHDRKDTQWTDLHRDADHLVVLAQALGWAKPLMPRRGWYNLPGGLPYYRFNFEKEPSVQRFKLDLTEHTDEAWLSRCKLWETTAEEHSYLLNYFLFERHQVDDLDMERLTLKQLATALANDGVEMTDAERLTMETAKLRK